MAVAILDTGTNKVEELADRCLDVNRQRIEGLPRGQAFCYSASERKTDAFGQMLGQVQQWLIGIIERQRVRAHTAIGLVEPAQKGNDEAGRVQFVGQDVKGQFVVPRNKFARTGRHNILVFGWPNTVLLGLGLPKDLNRLVGQGWAKVQAFKGVVCGLCKGKVSNTQDKTGRGDVAVAIGYAKNIGQVLGHVQDWMNTIMYLPTLNRTIGIVNCVFSIGRPTPKGRATVGADDVNHSRPGIVLSQLGITRFALKRSLGFPLATFASVVSRSRMPGLLTCGLVTLAALLGGFSLTVATFAGIVFLLSILWFPYHCRHNYSMTGRI